MADELKIVASLDIPISADGINTKDIPKLEKKLSRIKIKAELDPERSLNKIQSQLNTIVKKSKVPKIKVEIDTSDVKKAIKNVETQLPNNSSKSNNKVQIFDSKQLDAEGRKYFTKATNIIDQVKNYYTRNGALSVDISSIEKSNGQIKSFTASVEESTGVIKKFNFERGKIDTGGAKPNYGFVQTDSLKSIDRNAGANLKSTLNFLTRIDEKIMSIQSKSTKQANPLKEGTVYYDNYNKKLSETVAKIEEIKSANKTLSIEQKNEIDKMVTELQLYAKEQQKLAYPPMISSTSVEDSVKKAQATLTTLEQKWKNQGILTGEFKTQVANLRAELDKVGNTEGLNKYNTSLKVVQENAKQLFSTQKEISTAITQLNSLQNSPTFTKNASNPQVTQTKQDINSLITAYQNLATKLQGNITPAGLETIRTELIELNARFNDTTATAKRFETELRNDNGAEKLAQRVALLKARLESLAKANPKALKRFGNEINSLMATLNNNPDARTVDQVTKSVQLLGREINNADLAGKTFFQNLKEKAAKFTGWMSMTYAISLFTRSIRQAITELKEVDTLLTEISKANDKLTKSQLAQMGSNSFGIASKYGKQATDYLKGVQEMSRAGYTNAEAMGELSTAAQGAGDMTADVANQFIIAADKAYKMNGSVETLTKTLDGINYITNNNAVNMSELSEGFSIVSSTAASFGVRADELSAALGTMAATTQQSGSEVARAFRAILLNIRQVSDEEENIDAEGLTKYEKACNALGVSLKEVKDGVLQLRDPMQVLKELSVEYNKLSETDLKRTNLLNSVGGKLRSTQLDALLRQWSMYEEMLQQYEAGSGSMAREANNYCLVA